MLHFAIIGKQDPETLSPSKKSIQSFLVESYSLRLVSTDPHLSCKPQGHAGSHRLMKPIEPHHLQKTKEQIWGSQPRQSPLLGCALSSCPWIDQTGPDWRATLVDFNTYWKHVWLCAENVNPAHTLLVWGPNGPHIPAVSPTGLQS